MNNNMRRIAPEFSPNLLHPYYFIRKGLLYGIGKYSKELTGKLLDFGCGSKPYRSLFEVESYIGLDFENPGHPHENEDIDVLYDGENIPFSDQYFDSVLCTEVLEHVFNPDIVLKEIFRVLKPGGKLLVTCPFVWNEHEIPHDFARYSRFGLEDLLNRNGFELLHFEKSGNFLTTVFQLLNLYFFEFSKGRWYSFIPFRMLYKIFIYGLNNCLGLTLSRILPNNDSLYLNNVALFVKKSDSIL